MSKSLLLILAFAVSALADTPPPGTVKAKMFTGDGVTSLTATGTSLNSNITNLSLPVIGTFWQATQPVSLVTLPALAAGSATIGNVNINGTVPISGSVTATNTANGNTGSAVPAAATQVGGSDGANLRALKVSSTGVLAVDGSAVTQPVSATSLPLPTGASISANQIVPINTGTCAFTATGQTACIMSTGGASALQVTPSGTWSGLIGVECTATTSGVVGWALLPAYINTSPGSTQYFFSTNDNATVAIGSCARIQLASFSSWTGTANINLSLTPGIPAAVPVISGAPGQFYTTSNMRDGSNNALSSTAGALNVQVQNTSIPVTGNFWQATQPISAAALPLPTGAATAANQTTINTTLGNPFQAGGSIGNTSFGISGTLPAYASTPTFNLGTLNGAATAANQTTGNSSLSSIVTNTGNIPAQGQALAAGSMPVVLTAAQLSTLTPLSSVTVAGTVTANAGTGTFAVSAASLPLPSGAATSAKQPALGTAGTPSADVITVQGSASMTALKVDGSGVTQPVSAASLPLPTGAATAAGLTTINTTLGVPMQQTGGSVTANAGTGTFAVSAATLPLPSGAATAANQTSGGQKAQIVDPTTGTGTNVSLTGQLQASIDPTEVFTDAFEGGVVDTTNRWNAAVTAGGGTVTQAASQLVLTVSTTASNAAAISSQGSFPTAGGSIRTFAVGVTLESGTIATGNYRFWGLANPGTAYSTTNPISNGVGFEVTTAGVLRAVMYSSDVLISSTNLTVPTDGIEHVYFFEARGNFITFFMDSSTIPVATIGLTNADISTLPIRIASLNGGSSTTGTPLLKVAGSAVLDSGRNASAISDGSYGWRKATVSTTGALKTDSSAVTQPVSATSLPLPTGASTSALQTTGNTSLASIDTKTPALGQTTMAGSTPVVLASDQTTVGTTMPDLYFTGQAAQTATVNNIIPAAVSANATDAAGYRSASVQIVSTGTGGTFIFEGSNDNSNFQTIPVYSQLILTGTPITAAITPTATQLIYTFPVQVRYIRVRIATTITGGSIQAFTRFSQAAWTPAIFQVAQATAANLATTATIASGTVTTVSTVSSVTSDNLAIPGIIADVASAAITTTANTATLTPTFGVGYKVTIPVTVVSGTTPTYSVAVQESGDTGTNWTTVYTFPTITTTGYYESPPLFFKGNRVRYAQTLTGTTPSFTRAINRLQMSAVAATSVNNNASLTTTTVPTTCSTLTAPANAVAFILENLSSNTVNMFWSLGATLATSTTGMLLEPGRDTGEVHAGSNVTLCAASGTPTYAIQWVQQ